MTLKKFWVTYVICLLFVAGCIATSKLVFHSSNPNTDLGVVGLGALGSFCCLVFTSIIQEGEEETSRNIGLSFFALLLDLFCAVTVEGFAFWLYSGPKFASHKGLAIAGGIVTAIFWYAITRLDYERLGNHLGIQRFNRVHAGQPVKN